MNFDELLDKACIVAGLPDIARIQIPSTLSDQVKKALLKLTPEEVGKMLSVAIDAVNNGSIDPLDKLIREQIK